jgi:Fur family ferric uptake transcriptional regulator
MRAKLRERSKSLLSKAGLRRTGQRVTVLSAMLEANKPVSADELDRKYCNKVNKVTIYRIMESFLEAGLVHKAFLRKRTQYFELSDNCTAEQCHPHFTCTDCGQIRCFPEVLLPMAKSPYKGFVIDRQMVQLEGICPECNERINL